MKYFVNSCFDKVFVLNLKSESAKKDGIIQKFNKFNIAFEFFEGVNGYSCEFSREWEFYCKRPLATYFEKAYNKKFIESRGAWGYLKTMISLLTHALQQKYKRILVFDNDCLFAHDFNSRFDQLMHVVDNDWKILLLGASQYNWNVKFNNRGFYYPTKFGTCGSFAIGYDCSIIYEVIEEAKKMETPFDNLPLGKIYENYPGKCFVAYPNITIADVRESLIRQSRDIYEHSKAMQWKLEDFEILVEQTIP